MSEKTPEIPTPTLDFEIYFSDEQKEKINSMYHKIFELGGYNKL